MATWQEITTAALDDTRKEAWQRLAEGATAPEPRERGFFSNIIEAYRRGQKEVLSDVAAFEAIHQGKGDIERVRNIKSKMRKKELLDPIDGNWFEDMVFGSSKLLGGWLASVGEGAKTGAAAGATAGLAAAAAGQAGPQVAFPEEIATVPGATAGGFSAGFTAGTAAFWYKQGAGSMALDMIEEGTDPETARKISAVAAVPYAAIEFFQLKQAAPTVRKPLQRGLRELSKKILKRFGVLPAEVGEEVAQEIIQMGAEDVAKIARGEGFEISPEVLQDKAQRLWTVAKESTKSMALLPLPGAMVDVATTMPIAMESEAKADMAEPLPTEVPPEPEVQTLSIAEQAEARQAEAAQPMEGQMPTEVPTEIETAAGTLGAEIEEADVEEINIAPPAEQLSAETQETVGKITKTYRQYTQKRTEGVKSDIAYSTGMKAIEDVLEVGTRTGLKSQLRIEQKVANEAFRSGVAQEKAKLQQFKQATKIGENFRSEMRRMVQQYLPMEERGRLLTAVEKAKNPKQLTEGIERLSQTFDNMLRKHEIKKLKVTIKKLNKKFGRRGGTYRMLPEIAEPLEAIVQSIDLKKPTEVTRAKLLELQDYIETEQEAVKEQGLGEDPYIQFALESARQATARLRKVPVGEMSPDAIEQIRNSILFLVSQQITRDQLAGKEKAEEMGQALDEIYDDIGTAKNGVKEIEDNEAIDNTKVKRITGPLKRLFSVGQSNLDALAIVMSGGKEGKLHKYIATDIARGERDRYEHLYTIKDYVTERMKQEDINESDLKGWSQVIRKSFLKKDKPQTHDIKLESGKTVRLSVGNMMDIYMHTLNQDNYKALTGENGVYLSASKERLPQLTSDDVMSIITQLPEKARVMCGIMQEAIKVQQMSVNNVSIALDGFELATVDNYWHIRRKMPKKVAGKEASVYAENIESRSAWKERVGGKQPLVIGDAFNNFVDTAQVGAEYVGMAAPYRNARKILQDDALQQLCDKKGFRDHLNAAIEILNTAQEKTVKTSLVGELVGKMTRNVTRAIFSYAPRLAAQQRFSIALAVNEFSPKYLTAITGTVGKNITKEINEHSPYFRHRFEGYIGREFGDVARTGSVFKFFTGKDMWFNKPTDWVKQNDQAAVTDIWRMAKAEVKDKGQYEEGSIAYWDAVAERAEYVVRKTQPTWEQTTRSIIGATKQPLVKGLTLFHSQREKMYQMLQIATVQFINSDQKAGDLSKMLKTYGLVAGNTAAVNLWKQAYNLAAAAAFAALINGDLDDEEQENFWVDWATDAMSDLFGLVYFVGPFTRDAIKSGIRRFRGEPIGIKPGISLPAVRGIETLVEAADSWVKFLQDAYTYGETDTELALEALFDTAESAQYIFGGPLLPLVKWARKWKEEEL